MRAPLLTFKRARALRRAMTLPEVLLWQALRGGQVGGLRFRRQHPIGHYVLDFYCPALRLAVEVDGAAHDIPEGPGGVCTRPSPARFRESASPRRRGEVKALDT